MLQTQGKIMKNWSSSVDTRSGQCVDTSPSSVDTRGLPEHLLGKTGQAVSTLGQVVSTLETFPKHLLGCTGTVCRH
ncbi:hypothetical protein Taro_050110 [Colocasia esculenta]|uniref:Uncharacterized protein n=1 Tax=Colocasia esculenta TaxID=4460 RepID=A0A843XCY3_COLES|nr:hypothetical protein [Colocasia esculenta]